MEDATAFYVLLVFLFLLDSLTNYCYFPVSKSREKDGKETLDWEWWEDARINNNVTAVMKYIYVCSTVAHCMLTNGLYRDNLYDGLGCLDRRFLVPDE